MEDARPPLVGLQPQGQVTSFKRRLVSRIKMKSVRKQLRMGGGVTWNRVAEGGRKEV